MAVSATVPVFDTVEVWLPPIRFQVNDVGLDDAPQAAPVRCSVPATLALTSELPSAAHGTTRTSRNTPAAPASALRAPKPPRARLMGPTSASAYWLVVTAARCCSVKV